MYRLFLTVFLIVIGQAGFTEVSDLQNKTIYVEYDQRVGLFTVHTIERGQTLYSISRNYRSTVSDILLANSSLDINDLKIGLDIRVPINATNIASIEDKDSKGATYYKVKKGETLYSIAKRYFGKGVKELKHLNGLEEETIVPGQVLYVGLLDAKKPGSQVFKPVVVELGGEEERPVKRQPKIDEHGFVYFEEIEDSASITKNEALAFPPIEGPDVIAANGTAFWNKSDYQSEGRFVLHRTAKVNSMIEIANPMSNVTIQARVIGELPSNLYSRDIDMIISPAIAKELKVLDSKFFVKTRFIPK